MLRLVGALRLGVGQRVRPAVAHGAGGVARPQGGPGHAPRPLAAGGGQAVLGQRLPVGPVDDHHALVLDPLGVLHQVDAQGVQRLQGEGGRGPLEVVDGLQELLGGAALAPGPAGRGALAQEGLGRVPHGRGALLGDLRVGVVRVVVVVVEAGVAVAEGRPAVEALGQGPGAAPGVDQVVHAVPPDGGLARVQDAPPALHAQQHAGRPLLLERRGLLGVLVVVDGVRRDGHRFRGQHGREPVSQVREEGLARPDDLRRLAVAGRDGRGDQQLAPAPDLAHDVGEAARPHVGLPGAAVPDAPGAAGAGAHLPLPPAEQAQDVAVGRGLDPLGRGRDLGDLRRLVLRVAAPGGPPGAGRRRPGRRRRLVRRRLRRQAQALPRHAVEAVRHGSPPVWSASCSGASWGWPPWGPPDRSPGSPGFRRR